MREQIIALDRERHLRFTMNSLVAIEEQTGQDMAEYAKQLASKNGKLRVADIRLLLWAMLLDEDPTLTVQAVGSMIPMERLGEVATAVTAVFNDAMPGESPLVESRPV